MARPPDFSINGRFLGKAVTGVQRYALNVVAAMDRVMTDRGRSAALLAPKGTRDPGLAALALREVGGLPGHGWEQVNLPITCRAPLLSLCNTGPLAFTRQVVCIHDANVFEAGDSYGFKFRMFYKLLHPLLARRAMTIATVSNHSARQISRWLSVPAAKIVVLPNGHEHALAWRSDKAAIAPDFFTGPDALEPGRFVLAIGSRARHKNLRLILQLAPELAAQKLRIVIVGGGADIFAGETLEPAANVRFTGPLSDDDLAFLMDRALCLVFPSWTEGFGLPIVEAMARGCPVISSDRASMPEVCGDAALLAAPDDPAKWMTHIRQLVASPDLRADQIARGSARVGTYSWAATGAGYVDLMQSLAARTE